MRDRGPLVKSGLSCSLSVIMLLIAGVLSAREPSTYQEKLLWTVPLPPHPLEERLAALRQSVKYELRSWLLGSTLLTSAFVAVPGVAAFIDRRETRSLGEWLLVLAVLTAFCVICWTPSWYGSCSLAISARKSASISIPAMACRAWTPITSPTPTTPRRAFGQEPVRSKVSPRTRFFDCHSSIVT